MTERPCGFCSANLDPDDVCILTHRGIPWELHRNCRKRMRLALRAAKKETEEREVLEEMLSKETI